ncbi:unnamed protein product [Amoebophrya sp. A120]|nr:unnamed protein product [Amoebophrya sp. A120]|eukprot:GSA120T00011449001.1
MSTERELERRQMQERTASTRRTMSEPGGSLLDGVAPASQSSSSQHQGQHLLRGSAGRTVLSQGGVIVGASGASGSSSADNTRSRTAGRTTPASSKFSVPYYEGTGAIAASGTSFGSRSSSSASMETDHGDGTTSASAAARGLQVEENRNTGLQKRHRREDQHEHIMHQFRNGRNQNHEQSLLVFHKYYLEDDISQLINAQKRLLVEKNSFLSGGLIVGLVIGFLFLFAGFLWTRRWVKQNVMGETNKDLFFQMSTKHERLAEANKHIHLTRKTAEMHHPTLESLDGSVWEVKVIDHYRNSGRVTLPEAPVEYDDDMRPVVSKAFSGHYRFSLTFNLGHMYNITGLGFDETDGTSTLQGFYEETNGVMIFEEKFQRTDSNTRQPMKAMVELLLLGHVGQRRSMKGKSVPTTRIPPCIIVGADCSDGADTSLPIAEEFRLPGDDSTGGYKKKRSRVPAKPMAGLVRKMTGAFGLEVKEKKPGSPTSSRKLAPEPTSLNPNDKSPRVSDVGKGKKPAASPRGGVVHDPRDDDFLEKLKKQEVSAMRVQAAARGRLARKKTSPMLKERRKEGLKQAGYAMQGR